MRTGYASLAMALTIFSFLVSSVLIVPFINLLYKLKITRRVEGAVQLAGGDIDRKLLMGSASSGKYRFDAGVTQGTMTITFRDGNGKSVGKLSTAFHLQFGDTVLTSVDGKFTYTLEKAAKGVYFITMPTFLQPDPSLYVAWQNGYGVFASDGKPHAGTITGQ